MRELIFRGKRIDNGQWVEGSPFIFKDSCKMICGVAIHPDFVDEGNVYYSEGFPVHLSTVGQYTGLKDKNGKRIFEGDIIQTAEYGREASGKNYSGKDTFCVRYEHGGFCIENSTRQFSLKYNEKMEIIGNIHDNPELLDTTEV